MIRFVVKVKWKCQYSGADGEEIRTFDIDVPELQKALTVGGFSEGGFELAQLLGVEILPPPPEQNK
jgi:hypothetical protein